MGQKLYAPDLSMWEHKKGGWVSGKILGSSFAKQSLVFMTPKKWPLKTLVEKRRNVTNQYFPLFPTILPTLSKNKTITGANFKFVTLQMDG